MEGFSQAGADFGSPFFLLTKAMLATFGRTLGSWGEHKLQNTKTARILHPDLSEQRPEGHLQPSWLQRCS